MIQITVDTLKAYDNGDIGETFSLVANTNKLITIMRDPNCSFASLFDKTIPFDYEISKDEIKKLVESHKEKYPRDVNDDKVSKRKFKDYLKELGMPKWEIQILKDIKNTEGWFPTDIENLATFAITQSIIPLASTHMVIITNAVFLGIL